jgi:hypothetical protein
MGEYYPHLEARTGITLKISQLMITPVMVDSTLPGDWFEKAGGVKKARLFIGFSGFLLTTNASWSATAIKLGEVGHLERH